VRRASQSTSATPRALEPSAPLGHGIRAAARRAEKWGAYGNSAGDSGKLCSAHFKIYCVYIAPNAEMVREHAKQGGFPANSVAEVKMIIDPTSSERGGEIDLQLMAVTSPPILTPRVVGKI
jgi:hypothetical protein